MGQNAKSATSGTCNDTTLGLITVLVVIDPDYGCVVALGKLLPGRLGAIIQLSKVRKVDRNGPNGKTRDSDPE